MGADGFPLGMLIAAGWAALWWHWTWHGALQGEGQGGRRGRFGEGCVCWCSMAQAQSCPWAAALARSREMPKWMDLHSASGLGCKSTNSELRGVTVCRELTQHPVAKAGCGSRVHFKEIVSLLSTCAARDPSTRQCFGFWSYFTKCVQYKTDVRREHLLSWNSNTLDVSGFKSTPSILKI